MYCLIDLQRQVLFFWNGEDIEPKRSHGVFVNHQASMAPLSFIYSLGGSLQPFASLPVNVPVCFALRIPKVLCQLARLYCSPQARIASESFKNFLKLKSVSFIAFAIFGLFGCYFSLFSTDLVRRVVSEDMQRDNFRARGESVAPIVLLQKYVSEFTGFSDVSPRSAIVKDFSLGSPAHQNHYKVFPLYDYFSRTLQISVELNAGAVYVYTTAQQWELLRPAKNCGTSKLFRFNARDKFFVVLKSDFENGWNDVVSMATLPMNYAASLDCHAELTRGP